MPPNFQFIKLFQYPHCGRAYHDPHEYADSYFVHLQIHDSAHVL